MLVAAPPKETLYYTDDTQMAIGVAEALVEDGIIREATLFRIFAANYVPSRGYGFGARLVLSAMESGEDYRKVAETSFPGGSFGNGAAMRVAPVGAFFHHDPDQAWEQARLSALPTHLHPLGIEGAQLLALAAAQCVCMETFARMVFFDALRARCQSDVFQEKIEFAATAAPEDLEALGNGIQAQESVATAIACFASAPEDYTKAVGRAILLGGDTDTIAAMTGALSGAFLGTAGIPTSLLDRLEDEGKGRSYLTTLAAKLHAAHAALRAG